MSTSTLHRGMLHVRRRVMGRAQREAGSVAPAAERAAPAPPAAAAQSSPPSAVSPSTARSPAAPGAPNERDAPEPEGETEQGQGVWAGLRFWLALVAPTTIVTALLYYYGYVTTTARFAYFGLDLAVLRMSQQELALRSIGALFAPMAALLFAGILGTWIHAWVSAALARPGDRHRTRTWVRLAVAIGAVLLVHGVVGIVVPGLEANEPIAATPLSLAVGTLVLAYGRGVLGRIRGEADGRPGLPGTQRALGSPSAADRGSWVLVWGLVVLSLFWVANSFAAAYGTGQAIADADALDQRAAVVVDTQERLYLTLPGVAETRLPSEAGQRFRYRYRGLRLLSGSSGRLFLVSQGWRDPSSGVVVIADDTSVRLEFSR